MSKRRWHASYPPGMKAELDLPDNETLVRMLARSFAAYPDRTIATTGAESLSFAQLDHLAAALSAHFAAAGLRPGDRVALMMPNHLAFPIALVAVLRSGLIAVPVNPLYTARELTHQLADAGARCIVLTDVGAGVDPRLFAGEVAVLRLAGGTTKRRWPREGPSAC